MPEDAAPRMAAAAFPLERVTLARILRPRGRKGEVAAEILTDFPERLTRLRDVWLWDGARPTDPPQRRAVRVCWLHKDQAIFHFEGCDSISEAEQFIGLDVQVSRAERLGLPAGRYYITDLIGCEIWEINSVEELKAGKEEKHAQEQAPTSLAGSSSSSYLGVVQDVRFVGEETPGTPLLVVEAGEGELLIPLAEEICVRIAPAARRIDVVLPSGLRELNRDAG